jgi:hypothetical protein
VLDQPRVHKDISNRSICTDVFLASAFEHVRDMYIILTGRDESGAETFRLFRGKTETESEFFSGGTDAETKVSVSG